MTTKLPKELLEKIQKLYALSGNNPNQHEAESAANKVQELLARYNLTLDTVLLKQEEVDKMSITPDFSHEWWTRKLAQTIAEEFNCGYYRHETSFIDEFGIRVNTFAINFYGLPSDLEVVNYTFTFLHRTILSLLRKQKTQSPTFRQNYALGIVDEIKEKLHSQRKHQEQSYSPKENEIMVIKNQKVEMFGRSMGISNVSIGHGRQNANAYSNGRSDGKGISINQGVKSGSGIKRIC